MVKVYAQDRVTVLGVVTKQTTSIGAAKAAGTIAAYQAKIDGAWAWVAKDEYGKLR